MQSEQIGDLCAALVKAQRDFKPVLKTKRAVIPTKAGGQYSYNYADLADIREAIVVALEGNGLFATQMPSIHEGQPALTTTLMHVSGQWISEVMLLHVVASDAQGQGSAITYARRYALSAMLGIVTEDDDDGNAATDQRRDESGNRPAPRGPQNGPSAPKPGHPTVDEERILEAARIAPGNSFLVSLAEGFAKHGSLTDRQVESGLKAANSVLDQVRVLTPVGDEWPPDEDRF